MAFEIATTKMKRKQTRYGSIWVRASLRWDAIRRNGIIRVSRRSVRARVVSFVYGETREEVTGNIISSVDQG